jgi:hypothetical protein
MTKNEKTKELYEKISNSLSEKRIQKCSLILAQLGLYLTSTHLTNFRAFQIFD